MADGIPPPLSCVEPSGARHNCAGSYYRGSVSGNRERQVLISHWGRFALRRVHLHKFDAELSTRSLRSRRNSPVILPSNPIKGPRISCDPHRSFVTRLFIDRQWMIVLQVHSGDFKCLYVCVYLRLKMARSFRQCVISVLFWSKIQGA